MKRIALLVISWILLSPGVAIAGDWLDEQRQLHNQETPTHLFGFRTGEPEFLKFLSTTHCVKSIQDNNAQYWTCLEEKTCHNYQVIYGSESLVDKETCKAKLKEIHEDINTVLPLGTPFEHSADGVYEMFLNGFVPAPPRDSFTGL